MNAKAKTEVATTAKPVSGELVQTPDSVDREIEEGKGNGGIALYKNGCFTALHPTDPEIAEALAAFNETGESIKPGDYVRVPIPSSGGTIWEITGASTERTEEIRGCLLHIQPAGVLWAGEDPVEGQKPVLSTFDLKFAQMRCAPEDVPADMMKVLEEHKVEGKEGWYHWKDLPYTQQGTGKHGAKSMASRAREQRMLFILRPDDLFPIVVTVQPGSLTNFKKFHQGLPQARLTPWRSIVSLKLESTTNATGQKYSKIVPILIGSLSQEDGREMFKITETIKRHISEGLLDDQLGSTE